MNSLNISKFILPLFSSFELKFHNDDLIPLTVFYPIRKKAQITGTEFEKLEGLNRLAVK